LQQEQEIYELEGLRFRKVEYVDNQPVIDVAEDRRSGVFALLDEACLMPRSSDQTFTTTVHSKHLGSKFLTAPINRRGVKKRLLEDEAFVVLHFAGEVTYETSRFLDKNNDTIHDELLAVLAGSANPFVRSLVPVVEAEECTYGPSGGRFKSVSANFSGQLGKLMGVLQKTTSHFIRCIKPNEMQKPMVLEPVSVMTQLRYSGMCAALILMQAGFPTRVSFQELYDRYKPHMPRQLLKLKPITFCEAILVALDLDGGRDFQMGLTKVFFRPGKLAQVGAGRSSRPSLPTCSTHRVTKQTCPPVFAFSA
jgi:myosin-6